MTAAEAEQKLSRKDRERETHRQEILAVAERLIARKGYRATTMEEIAREAEFAVGTLYTLFKDKDELYTRIVEGFATALVTQFEREVVPLADPRAAVAALIETRLRTTTRTGTSFARRWRPRRSCATTRWPRHRAG